MSKRLSPWFWRKRKKECFERDAYKCQAPGVHWGELDPHHIVHRSKGGSDDLSNLITLCRAHHDFMHPEKQTKWTPGLNAMREEAKRDFEKLYPKQQTQETADGSNREANK